MGFKHLTSAATVILQVCALSVSFATHAVQAADAPTQDIVEKVMKRTWDKAASAASPKSTLTLNSVKFGKAYKATLQETQVEGIPQNSMVTPAVVDFTVRNFHSNQTQAVRRVREARVFRDKMNEWAVMTGSVKGQDVTTHEPAVK
jgi:hypothetical protein